jgi:hypothetical protein
MRTATTQTGQLRLVGGVEQALANADHETRPRRVEFEAELVVRLPPSAGDATRALRSSSQQTSLAPNPLTASGTLSPTGRQYSEGATTSESDARYAVDLPAIVVPPRMKLEDRYRVLHQWEGTVVEVARDGFRARLAELRAEQREEEYADFSFESVSEDDRVLVVPGAIFYWFVGYRTENSGQRNTWSTVRFRRLPRWTKRELDSLAMPSDLDEFFEKQ